jgi:hypothetical protein
VSPRHEDRGARGTESADPENLALTNEGVPPGLPRTAVEDDGAAVGAPEDGPLVHVFSRAEKARLRWFRLPDAEFDRVDFAGADLRGSRFERVSLRGADFSGADLRGARFVACDLRGARWSGVQLGGTRWTGCRLEGATGWTLAQTVYLRRRGERAVPASRSVPPGPASGSR